MLVSRRWPTTTSLSLSSVIRLQAGASHCCAIGPSDNGGGQVEKNVRDARSRLWQVMPIFTDLAELNQWLEDRCVALWSETRHRELPGTIADVWEAEKPTLMALPPAFDGFVEHSKRVSPTCLITFERNRYSVPASFANRPVSLHVYPEQLVVMLKACLWHDGPKARVSAGMNVS